MTTRHYIVLVNDGVDLDQFWNEMATGVSASPYIPKRPATIINSRELFPRLCEYELSDEEANALRNDARVAEVDIPVDQNPNVSIGPMSVQDGNFSRIVNSPWSSYINWGLTRHSNIDTTNNSTAQYQYTLDGTGVDVLISDSGIQVDHPEFTDANGASRVRQIEWGTVYAPLQYKGGYIDNNGHGTNVAGIAAGKNYGWAKNSDIYALYAPGTWATENPSSVVDHFEGILRWHQAKTNGRPTVVNMSWGYFIQSSTEMKNWIINNKLTNIVYRGTAVNYLGTGYTMTDANINSRIINETGLRIDRGIAYENQSSDYGIQNLVDNGIVVCHCAGNFGTKNDRPGGADYDNYMQIGGYSTKFYYNRGSSPKSAKSISVGNMDTDFYNTTKTVEQKHGTSCAGPDVDVFAAGTNIVSAGSNRVTANPAYPKNTVFKTSKYTGTSQASPQIAGMCALYLQTNPTATPAQVKEWIVSSANTAVINRGGSADYSDRSLFGSTAGVAYLKSSANITNVSKTFAKAQSGNWQEVASIFVKQNDTDWIPVKTGYIKTTDGWKVTYKQGS